MTNANEQIPSIFDADNHYWETSDAFTRHRDPKFADRGVRAVDVDGKPRYMFAASGSIRSSPVRATCTCGPRPGALYDYFAGTSDKARARQRARVRGAGRAPRVVRPRRAPGVHGRAGRRGGVAVPVAGRLHGRADAARHRGVDPHPAGLQPLARGGLGLRLPGPHLRRAVPHPVRRRPGGRASWSGASSAARGSSRSATARRSRPTARSRRPIRCSTRSGPGSPEAGVVVAPHAGFEDGYTRGRRRHRRGVGPLRTARGPVTPSTRYSTVVTMLMKHRLVHDFAAILVADGLFERHPGVRVAYIENGGTWVGDLLHGLQVLARSEPGDVPEEPGRPVHRALLGRAVRGGHRRPSSPRTSRSSGSCSAPTGRTPRAWAIRATSSRKSRNSRSTTSAGSWWKTHARSRSHERDRRVQHSPTTTQDLETTQQLNHIEMLYRPGEQTSQPTCSSCWVSASSTTAGSGC